MPTTVTTSGVDEVSVEGGARPRGGGRLGVATHTVLHTLGAQVMVASTEVVAAGRGALRIAGDASGGARDEHSLRARVRAAAQQPTA